MSSNIYIYILAKFDAMHEWLFNPQLGNTLDVSRGRNRWFDRSLETADSFLGNGEVEVRREMKYSVEM